MTTYEISVIESLSPAEIRATVEELCSAHGLTAASAGTLKTYPGSVHWHFKKGTQRGVLEITLWPEKHRLWLSTRPGRDADWVFNALNALGDRLQTLVGGTGRQQR